ncbi:uncharacterized protein ARMOST_21676 [Armillaria ostoyae]|uniref:Uncharacterized protein n=1 Tax=Armillaria ostoyae TaxID=47428 RepID=A0A284SAR5_ARMOS|nr:uncharacterized protein ARMOST_21676 [Armillaria ostoyae]
MKVLDSEHHFLRRNTVSSNLRCALHVPSFSRICEGRPLHRSLIIEKRRSTSSRTVFRFRYLALCNYRQYARWLSESLVVPDCLDCHFLVSLFYSDAFREEEPRQVDVLFKMKDAMYITILPDIYSVTKTMHYKAVIRFTILLALASYHGISARVSDEDLDCAGEDHISPLFFNHHVDYPRVTKQKPSWNKIDASREWDTMFVEIDMDRSKRDLAPCPT